jgi:hypothetical protein
MNAVPYTLTPNSVSIFIDNDMFSIGTAHKLWDKITAAIRAQDWDRLPDLIDQAKGIKKYVAPVDGLAFENGEIFFNGQPLGGFAVDFIKRLNADGYDTTPFVRYLSRLMQNPDARNREHQFEWLIRGQMPITPEGKILAFKKVRHDYKDIHSGTMDNSIGRIVSMDREECDADYDITCSTGLHFCSREYLPEFRSSYSSRLNGDDRILILELDPADIVAFPRDYNVAKGRACKYTVIGEIGGDTKPEEILTKPVDDFEPRVKARAKKKVQAKIKAKVKQKARAKVKAKTPTRKPLAKVKAKAKPAAKVKPKSKVKAKSKPKVKAKTRKR